MSLFDVAQEDSGGGAVWTGRLPGVPGVGTVLATEVGHGTYWRVVSPGTWRLKTPSLPGASSRPHEVSGVLVWVERVGSV